MGLLHQITVHFSLTLTSKHAPTNPPPNYQGRLLCSTNLLITDIFEKNANISWKENRIHERINSLASSPLPRAEKIKIIETIDKDITTLLLQAEKDSNPHSHKPSPAYSPKIVAARNTHHKWKIILKNFHLPRHANFSSNYFNSHSLSLEDILSNIKNPNYISRNVKPKPTPFEKNTFLN